MEASFWHKCWERNSLGFHQETVHPFLEKCLLPHLKKQNQRVFVPLCGKSLDMFWLAEHMEVVGSELSDIACHDFFSEQHIAYEKEDVGDFNCFSFDNISLWQGDFFKLSSSSFEPFDWIYDRAAIIALPRELRNKYVQHLRSFLSKGTKILLISLEFPEHELSGPPFPVTEQEVRELFNGYSVKCMASQELKNKRFAQRTFDVTSLIEKAYLIEH